MKNKNKRLIKIFLILLKGGGGLFILSVMGIFLADWIVEKTASKKVFCTTEEISYNKVGLLLGTGKILANGRINLYYKYRIEAAAELYKSGKISYILVSGDNSRKDYDEPSTMRNDLIIKGVPASKIFLDYAGFRTLDSVVRCKEVFGQENVTVISQQFHNERAIFIGKFKGVHAIGYNATDIQGRYGLKVKIREKLARVKMILDLITFKKPKYLGEKIEID